jgi:hypothetical protein
VCFQFLLHNLFLSHRDYGATYYAILLTFGRLSAKYRPHAQRKGGSYEVAIENPSIFQFLAPSKAQRSPFQEWPRLHAEYSTHARSMQ